LYEGTGLNGRSTLREVALETGEILRLRRIPEQHFGEGIAIVGDEIFQLTWQSGAGFVYNKDSFNLVREFTYQTEGWGLTYDGKHLIMSDGTATLIFRDPKDFAEVRRIEVTDDGGPVGKLNELEYIDGEIFTNVWQTDRIARIEPETGMVSGWIDLSGLLDRDLYGSSPDVLNGIAYDPVKERLFVTGKLWPAVFEIELVPVSG
jgi:glutamine cyclotransferase